MTSAKATPAIYLVDGSALAYRSHFAFMRTPLSNGKGLNTGAILGYTNTLWKILRDEKPTHLAVVFDHPQPTFRHEMYAEYKATRDKMPDEMRDQMPWMKRVTDALGVQRLEVPGFEADDVIATLAIQGANDGRDVRIVTGDKDFMQIVSDRIQLYDIMKQNEEVVIVDPAKVVEKFGVEPDKVIDVLALMGDASDNVPGVPLIGPKKATELVKKYGSLDSVLDHADDVKGKKTSENLKTHREQAELSRRLVTIDCDVKLEIGVDDLARQDPDRPAAAELFGELQFAALFKEFAETVEAEPEKVDYHIVETEAELDTLIAALREAGRFVIDLETTSLDPMEAQTIGLSFAFSSGEAWYVPLNAPEPILEDIDDDRPGTAVLERLRPVLEDASIAKMGQNAKYDLTVLVGDGVALDGITFDTMLASYLLEPGNRAHDLDSLSLNHFAYKKIPTTELIGKGKDQITMDLVPVADVGHYACEDADYTWRLFELFAPRLAHNDLEKLFETVEIPLIPVLSRMERTGIRVDPDRLDALRVEVKTKIAAAAKEVFALAGREFNINSPKQLGEVLFQELELHKELGVRPTKTKTGFSTNQAVLERMDGHPLPAKILEHRSLTKLLGTYIDALPTLIHPDTGRVHSNFNQAVAATGRLSSSDPNLQNIPVRSTLGRRIREAFVPSHDDWHLISCDYSQIELRVMAHFSGDPSLAEAFARGADIHTDTAARIFGKKPDEVDAILRSRAKAINFGILYGMGPQRLARDTGLDQKEALAFIERYFETFPSVRDFIDGTKQQARDEGLVTTLLGRKRPLPDIEAKNGRLRIAAENMAVNTPIQGSAADIIKLAMIEVDKWLRESGLETLLVLQVHDELVFDVPPSEVETIREKIPALMTEVVDLDVPLVVDTGVGRNWAEAH